MYVVLQTSNNTRTHTTTTQSTNPYVVFCLEEWEPENGALLQDHVIWHVTLEALSCLVAMTTRQHSNTWSCYVGRGGGRCCVWSINYNIVATQRLYFKREIINFLLKLISWCVVSSVGARRPPVIRMTGGWPAGKSIKLAFQCNRT